MLHLELHDYVNDTVLSWNRFTYKRKQKSGRHRINWNYYTIMCLYY